MDKRLETLPPISVLQAHLEQTMEYISIRQPLCNTGIITMETKEWKERKEQK
jgi:hypothetical protein